jgi:hypothetical protein
VFKITFEVRVPVDITGSYDAPERLHAGRKTFLEVNGVEETATKIEDGCRTDRLFPLYFKGLVNLYRLSKY